MNEFSISVVIPNYNGRALLEEILPSLVKVLLDMSHMHEIIVVDDNSTDDSISFLKLNYKDIIVSKNERNLGFSCTVNIGILMAKMDLVFILNNDVKLIDGYFDAQLPYFERQDTFGVNGAVFDWDSEVFQGGGKIINRHFYKIKANQNYFIKADTLSPETDYPTMFLSGTNALIDRKKLLLLNGYDDLLSPFYVEDVELSIRALRMGWKMYYSPSSKCMHQISTTIKKHNKKRKIKRLTSRNKFYLHYIHLEGFSLFFWYVQTLMEILFRTLMLDTIQLMAFVTFVRTLKQAKISKSNFNALMKNNGNFKAGLFSALRTYKNWTMDLIGPNQSLK